MKFVDSVSVCSTDLMCIMSLKFDIVECSESKISECSILEAEGLGNQVGPKTVLLVMYVPYGHYKINQEGPSCIS